MRVLLTGMLAALPLLMLVIGRSFVRVRPRSRHSKMYYRTERSMKNNETKRFAHLFCGRFYLWMGKRLLIGTAILAIAFLKFPILHFETACGIWMFLETVILLSAVPITECALLRKFA